MTVGLLLGIRATTPSSSGTGTALTRVPTFLLPRVGGGGDVGVPVDGGGHGRPAILLFFASWCSPCQKEIPAIARLYGRQHSGPSKLNAVAVVGIDGSDPTTNALSFMRSSGVTFPVGADAVYAVTQGKFGFSGLPESVFVRGNGTIAAVHYGAIGTAAFVSWEKKLAGGS